MRQYAIQLTDHDFEPVGAWSSNPQAAIAQVKTQADVDLLVWNPATDESQIIVQYTLETLVTKIDQTPYARLIEKMNTVLASLKQPVAPKLQRQWYLVGYQACLDHQALLNTAAALLSLTVAYLKNSPRAVSDLKQQLRGLADQARCWLLAARVSDLQLLATNEPLTVLLQHLLTQTVALDACQMAGRSVAWELANNAAMLSQVETDQFQLTQLKNKTAYRLIRAAYLERIMR
ncbi:hypothetical protein C5Z25_03785 [Lactobacillus sp. CBA3605]|uniref:hypothetical protein n=1 Tax=Lactobacillus sp. CBA3605 TaxID=2099788 RepID=UPI000CFDEEED|nr:hypothetical protein [Lactobacillus sp. CBA3605]AVK60929.1 hypothetical protein C5Z25_03785 [Lactobacillus sp. CBA3605]